ncbi:battenin CLN3 protein [Cladophialophora chaetospira]|uniref:Battenin CLN3 protein n=1 Tax=Cladophialophora chaetospira TaxID=386627 RepID=A0AA38X7C8_9EURO|nr:battenin CLN3 protein [Cladophialophora chaetospira]
MAPLPVNTLSVHRAKQAPTNLNIHIDAHQTPGYNYLAPNVPGSSTIQPRALAYGPQTFFPTLDTETHQNFGLRTYHTRHALTVADAEAPVTLGSWDYFTATLLFVLVIGMFVWTAWARVKLYSSAPLQPSDLHHQSPKIVIKVNKNAPKSYGSTGSIVPAEKSCAVDEGVSESAVETCELATDTALPLSMSAKNSVDAYLLNAARMCLINNVLYVIILSAALDLVGPNVPKGVVLLADVIPSFGVKLCAPYFIHVVPYSVRILVFVALSATGMLLISLTPSYTDGGTITTKLAGVILASLSSGGGELSFLGLVHYYGPFSLAAWGSGTGGAGLIGAGAYALATTTIGLSVSTTLLASAFLPAVMLVSFFLILPLEPLRRSNKPLDGGALLGEEDPIEQEQREGLLASPDGPKPGFVGQSRSSSWSLFKHNLARAKGLFFPYMLPLLLVYIAEYTINQGVSPTLLFPLKESPFKHFRAFYPAYNAIYQAGVFISRSSTPFLRVHNLYLPSFLQMANLLLLTLHALFNFIPNVYIVFAIIFWEGLLGGLVYVNTFAEISDTVPKEDREFSLSATTVSDSGGICIAGFIGMAFEVWLCNWQVRHGRDYCKKL